MGVKLISMMQAHKLLGRGCKGFLFNVVKTEGKGHSLKGIPVVKEFPDVFPNEIPGMPLLREVEFCIDQAPGATPTSRAPYRMTLAELKELKAQLEKLLE